MSKSFKVKSLVEGAVAITSNDGKEQIQFTELESKTFSEEEASAYSVQLEIFASASILSITEAKGKKTPAPTEPPADDAPTTPASLTGTEGSSEETPAQTKAELNAEEIAVLKKDLEKLGEEYKNKKTSAERKEAIKVESVNIKKKLRSLK